jgi:hypothetical protein
VVAKFTPVRDALDQILDDVGVAALNRLSPPAQYASPDDLRWLSDSDFQTIVDAHRDDVEAGRPDDGILLAALTNGSPCGTKGPAFHQIKRRAARPGRQSGLSRNSSNK